MVKNLETKLEIFSKEVQKAIAAYEKGLKGLENMLKAWNEWAACRKADPPTEEEHKKSKKEFEMFPGLQLLLPIRKRIFLKENWQ